MTGRPRRSTLFPYTTLFRSHVAGAGRGSFNHRFAQPSRDAQPMIERSEEHTSELQSRGHLVCRLLLEKKKAESIPTADSPTVETNSIAILAAVFELEPTVLN